MKERIVDVTVANNVFEDFKNKHGVQQQHRVRAYSFVESLRYRLSELLAKISVQFVKLSIRAYPIGESAYGLRFRPSLIEMATAPLPDRSVDGADCSRPFKYNVTREGYDEKMRAENAAMFEESLRKAVKQDLTWDPLSQEEDVCFPARARGPIRKVDESGKIVDCDPHEKKDE